MEADTTRPQASAVMETAMMRREAREAMEVETTTNDAEARLRELANASIRVLLRLWLCPARPCARPFFIGEYNSDDA